jgi:predicted DNA binding CopG/RHH family protein
MNLQCGLNHLYIQFDLSYLCKLDSSKVKNQHLKKKEKTRSITYRLPVKLVEEIEAEAENHNISHNVMARQILEKYVRWDRFANKIGIIPVPKKF